MSRHVFVPILALAMPVAAFAQTAADPAFDVASIRPAAAGVPRAMTITETRVDIRNYPLYALVLRAFRARPFQVSAPDWLRQVSRTEGRFDIQALIPDGATREQVPEMLRALLAERFGLATHVERRPVPAYELVVSAEGVKMREADRQSRPFGNIGFHSGRDTWPEARGAAVADRRRRHRQDGARANGQLSRASRTRGRRREAGLSGQLEAPRMRLGY